MTLIIQGCSFVGLTDTGADISVIAKQRWPRHWPLTDSVVPIRGVGQAHSPQLSATFLNWSTSEGHQGTFQSFILDIDLNLWGWDVLTDMGVTLNTAPVPLQNQPAVVMALMKKMGYHPGKGLGKHLQGDHLPIRLKSQTSRAGLGFPTGH